MGKLEQTLMNIVIQHTTYFDEHHLMFVFASVTATYRYLGGPSDLT